jgi:hypothetical protein
MRFGGAATRRTTLVLADRIPTGAALVALASRLAQGLARFFFSVHGASASRTTASIFVPSGSSAKAP